MLVRAKRLYVRLSARLSSFPERVRLVADLKRNGAIAEAVPSVVNFYHYCRTRYETHSLGDFKIEHINSISRHLSALEDLLVRAFGVGRERAKMLDLIIALRPRERTPLVLLAFWRLEEGNTQSAYDLARRALAIDSRCLNAQWILGQAVRQEPHLANIDPSDNGIFTRDLSDRFCAAPFAELITNPTGDVHTCCPLLLPVTIGNVYEHSWHEAWNSPESIEVRRSIHDGDFKYCSRVHCHYLRSNTLPKKSEIADPAMREIVDQRKTKIDAPPKIANLGHDATCNLSCPQCRTELIVAKGDTIQKLKRANTEFVGPLLKDLPHVVITNSGDPFASRHYREFMKTIDPNGTPGLQEITLLTNGVLLTPREWDNFANIRHLKINIVISVDAAKPETYNSIRRRGDFERLRKNLAFVSELRRHNRIATFHMRFAVQTENFAEMPAFAEWARELNADVVAFTRLANCGTYSSEEFTARSICDIAHPRHNELISTLGNPSLRWERILFDNIDALRPRISA
jgi:MoaA/NifB/PqqE/SkfB family radical SAM enzyme